LADDHALVRSGIQALLQNINTIEVLAAVSNGHEAIEAVADHRPKVVLLDINMKGLNGIEAASHIHKNHPHTHILMLSVHTAKEYLLQSLRA